jgi:RHS repeat-associated protein
VLEETVAGQVQTQYTYGMLLISQRRVSTGGAVNYYGYDAHGDVVFMTDALGSVTDEYRYDAYGNLMFRSGSTPNTRLYQGEELDPDLGLLFLRARYYSANSGRFLSSDPFDAFTEQLLRRRLAPRTQMIALTFSSEPIEQIRSLYLRTIVSQGAGARLSQDREHLMPLNVNRYLYVSGDPVNGFDKIGMTEEEEAELEDFVDEKEVKEEKEVGEKAQIEIDCLELLEGALQDCVDDLQPGEDGILRMEGPMSYDDCVKRAYIEYAECLEEDEVVPSGN